ncbi:hypothetical protein JTE90_015417 [Oedothorax gibbosus]|uniref:Uncharacterized protein n=1 Tax=Oedothorax gibbosus TaxID=931172 RepID=A0AAV6TZM4_9ARAC|nr:hypothetical protein JTE90_015417 [Oedothorax gibbosus]
MSITSAEGRESFSNLKKPSQGQGISSTHGIFDFWAYGHLWSKTPRNGVGMTLRLPRQEFTSEMYVIAFSLHLVLGICRAANGPPFMTTDSATKVQAFQI